MLKHKSKEVFFNKNFCLFLVFKNKSLNSFLKHPSTEPDVLTSQLLCTDFVREAAAAIL